MDIDIAINRKSTTNSKYKKRKSGTIPANKSMYVIFCRLYNIFVVHFTLHSSKHVRFNLLDDCDIEDTSITKRYYAIPSKKPPRNKKHGKARPKNCAIPSQKLPKKNYAIPSQKPIHLMYVILLLFIYYICNTI